MDISIDRAPAGGIPSVARMYFYAAIARARMSRACVSNPEGLGLLDRAPACGKNAAVTDEVPGVAADMYFAFE